MPLAQVLIVSEHMSRGYSGGRYYAWMIAEALAATGAAVTVWTNARPFLMRDFVEFPAHEQIVLHVDPYFRHAPAGRYDAVFLVPGLRLDWSVFAAAVATANRQNIPLVFLDFEAPSWYNAENSKKRSWLRVLPWKLSSRYAAVILSLTALGSQKAREYYRPAGGAGAFRHCYGAINSVAADRAQSEPQNQIICITRLDRATPHKGAKDLMSLMCDELRGFRVVVIGSIPDDVKRQLENAAAAHSMSFVSKSGLTDLEKFVEIKSSRLMVFLSHFEGFGYPPVEAMYCGVPCVTRPLPVLREVNGKYLHYLPEGTPVAAFVARVLAETNGQLPPEARDWAAHVGKFESCVTRMSALLSSLRTTAKPRRRRVGVSFFVATAWVTYLLCRLLKSTRPALPRQTK
jgi:glycosyltransferase involved in cell wall biosynthesis